MAEPTSNVKVYDRPERKLSAPLVLLVVLIAAVCVFFLYRSLHHTAPASSGNVPPGVLGMPGVVSPAVSSMQGLFLIRMY